MAFNSVLDRRVPNLPDDNETHPGAAPELTKANCASVDVDEVWQHLGRYGRYQLLSALLVLISMWAQSFAILSGVFVGMPVNHKCSSEANESLQLSYFPNDSQVVEEQCSVTVVTNSSGDGYQTLHEKRCSSFDYSTDESTSFIAEWDLVCDRETLGQLPQMLTMIGMMVGAISLPQIGDRYGRKTLAMSSQLAHLVVSIGMAYAPAFEIFLLLKFLSGAFNQGFFVTEYILLLELVPTDMRSRMSFVANISWILSVLSLVPIAIVFLGRSWRILQLAYALTSLSCLTLFFLDESLRWLLVNRNVKRAEKVLRKACKFNGQSMDTLMKTILHDEIASNGDLHQPLYLEPQKGRCNAEDVTAECTPKVQTANPSFKDVFGCPAMRKITLIAIYSWMVNSLTYYGITLLSTSLAGDPYINFTIGTALEIPSCICVYVLLTRFGRKTVSIAFTGAAGLSLLAAFLVAILAGNTYSLSLVQTGLTLFGKFCITASFGVMWLFTPELYPTNLRNVGIGVASMGARIAASASPFFGILASKAIWAPGALFSGACFLCVFLLTFLPETGHRELPSTIAEIEAWYREDKDKREGGYWKRIGKRVTTII